MKDVVKIFKALADPTRLRIMLLLGRRELCVCELMFILEMEQSRVSHHMRVLRDAGIAEDVREGRWIIYRIPEEARALSETSSPGPSGSGAEAPARRRATPSSSKPASGRTSAAASANLSREQEGS